MEKQAETGPYSFSHLFSPSPASQLVLLLPLLLNLPRPVASYQGNGMSWAKNGTTRTTQSHYHSHSHH